ncbi:hypothetical protein GCM10007939_02880 [Amylibacter marinus]|uniref:Uncharacterized protein n=1 Tax=Amylibacter marinus TaxID=1475483 RepID=A0ABQ5VRN7_9RHOB|nr:hypothetical protein GCM10007939_02880 [Amylibacter marinus]
MLIISKCAKVSFFSLATACFFALSQGASANCFAEITFAQGKSTLNALAKSKLNRLMKSQVSDSLIELSPPSKAPERITKTRMDEISSFLTAELPSSGRVKIAVNRSLPTLAAQGATARNRTIVVSLTPCTPRGVGSLTTATPLLAVGGLLSAIGALSGSDGGSTISTQ